MSSIATATATAGALPSTLFGAMCTKTLSIAQPGGKNIDVNIENFKATTVNAVVITAQAPETHMTFPVQAPSAKGCRVTARLVMPDGQPLAPNPSPRIKVKTLPDDKVQVAIPARVANHLANEGILSRCYLNYGGALLRAGAPLLLVVNVNGNECTRIPVFVVSRRFGTNRECVDHAFADINADIEHPSNRDVAWVQSKWWTGVNVTARVLPMSEIVPIVSEPLVAVHSNQTVSGGVQPQQKKRKTTDDASVSTAPPSEEPVGVYDLLRMEVGSLMDELLAETVAEYGHHPLSAVSTYDELKMQAINSEIAALKGRLQAMRSVRSNV